MIKGLEMTKHDIRKNLLYVFLIGAMSIFSLACTPDEEVWTGQDKNPIQVVCGKSCQTIYFYPGSADLTPRQQDKIRRFVFATKRNERVFVSPCVANPNNIPLNLARINAVRSEVHHLGYSSIKLKATLPMEPARNCVNLVRGKLHLYVENCPNLTLMPSVQVIGNTFGCTTNYNLAQMIVNPWNLLATSGDNGTEGDRVAIGEKNYRIGKVSKLDMESSS
jgi:type IV pilus biogenesis protein CpaD/CtpE